VDTGLLAALVGAPVVMADAKRVKVVTGSSIGGVPPFGHPEPLRTILDETLLTLPVVWAAAASAVSVFSIEPHRLAELTGATVARVS
jgi:prolyl-tRNA editing enzyme YbaK/EbsC (Cys-tRNA(Pro) deacylase)